jgi:hypothetical protein
VQEQAMSKHLPEQFVADGQQRIHATDEYRQKVLAIHTRVWTKYRDELVHASFWQRWCLQRKIRREIRQACADVAPDEALYLYSYVERPNIQ